MSLLISIKKWNKNRVLKRVLKDIGDAGIYETSETIYEEPVLIRIVENDESVLTIELLYAEINRIYRAMFLGNYNGTEMKIADIKVLKQPSYSPKNVEPFGKGYGTLLMTRAIEEAKNKGIKQITGDMVATSTAQLKRQEKFYTKFGFNIDEENKLYRAL